MKGKCEEMMKTINEASGESRKHIEDKKGGDHRLCTSTSHAYDSERKRKFILELLWHSLLHIYMFLGKHFTNRSTRSYSHPPIKRSCSSSSQMPRFSNYKPESLLQELQK
uniref:Ovule protein n=1 Tax=Heterorhabditis bacteriophora TaxID=37862 RepID=A0A1I7X2F6_HETBA